MIDARSLGARAPYILILEDLDDIANMLREDLSAVGYRCFSLRSRAAAERFLTRVRPDLVIVDYGLLGGTGIAAAQMARDANVPVIAMSGYLDVREVIEPLGFSFLQKPFRLAEMLDLVARLIPGNPATH
jgi:two-component system, OmpR family, response regulator VicR